MKIEGVLRIDLSEFVDRFGMLYVGDRETRALYDAACGYAGAAELLIGSATSFLVVDRRFAEALADVETLRVIGSDAHGVVAAEQAIRKALVPAPRGAI